MKKSKSSPISFSFIISSALICVLFLTHCVSCTPVQSLNLQRLIDSTPYGQPIVIPDGTYFLDTGLEVTDRSDITISARNEARILVRDVYANVIGFTDCGSVRLSNLYLAHAVPLDEYECHGSVVYARDCESIRVSNCDLNGCGAIGLSVWSCGSVMVSETRIEDNSFNALYVHGLKELIITESIIQNNGNLMQIHECREIEMHGNLIRNNGGYW